MGGARGLRVGRGSANERRVVRRRGGRAMQDGDASNAGRIEGDEMNRLASRSRTACRQSSVRAQELRY